MGRHATEHTSAQSLTSPSSPGEPMLICRAGPWNFAIPVGLVVETMRAQPIDRLAGAPGYVTGVSLIRGDVVPVVDVAQLLDGDGARTDGADRTVRRFVTITLQNRTVALAVSEVTGVEDILADTMSALPPLLGGSDANLLSSLGRLDGALLLTLAQTRLIPPETWAALDQPPDQPLDQPPAQPRDGRAATNEQVTSL